LTEENMVHPADAEGSGRQFGQCSLCQHVWATRADFLRDPTLKIIGYQAAFVNLVEGYFLFNHSCGTTLARAVGEFQDLYTGPMYTNRATGSDECPGYCLRKGELGGCSAQCECAWVRETIQIILNWPRDSDQQGVAEPPHLIG
jgi:hypothetical protein